MTVSLSGVYTSGSAGTLQYTGLTSDTPWVDVVDDLVELERFHINRLETWKSDWEEKITATQELDSRLLILETKAGNLNSAIEFYSRTSASGDEEVLTVTNTSPAIPGAHTVTVGSNIPHKLASQGMSSTDTVIYNGADKTMTIYVGSPHIDVTVTDGMTLSGLQAAIEAADSSDILTAEIIDDGSGTNPYRLVITANNGGPDHEISITQNPTDLNYYDNDISPVDLDDGGVTWTGATVTSMGYFTGVATGGNAYRTYTFTASGTGTMGSGNLTINWTGTNGGAGSGSFSVGSDYTPGDTITIEDGLKLEFESGNITSTQNFVVRAYSTDIDDPEMGTWNGTSSVTSDGNYLGSTNKTFNFKVSGSDTYTIGTDSFDITWTDTEGNSGTISVTDTSFTNLTVYQGVSISFEDTKTVKGGDTFSIDVFNSTLQANLAEGLAQVEVETHSGFVDENTSYVTSSEGTFSYTYGGVSRTITVAANSTLADLRGLINNDTDNPGVTATILDDGSGLSTAYHLQLIGNDSGAAYKIENITHTLDNFAKGGTTGYGFTQTQTAQNAMIKVDGYPADSDEYIQRDSNTISDAISGVTMSLLGTGISTISITNDAGAIRTKIEDFVDSINSVLDYIKEMMAYNEQGEGENNGPMIGNYTFQIVQQRINDILSSPVPGLTDGVDTYTHLAQIGIRTEADQIWVETDDGEKWAINTRRWAIDTPTLDAALSSDLEGVCKLFIEDETSGVDGIAELIKNEADTLTKSYSDANPGIVQVLINNYEGIIDNIDDKVEREERRIALVENRLNTRFARLEVILGQLQAQENYLTAMLDNLPTIGGD